MRRKSEKLMRKKTKKERLLLTIGITYTQALMRGWHVQDAKGSQMSWEVDRGQTRQDLGFMLVFLDF